MQKNVRTIILIDGSNFYYKLRAINFHNQLDFDFSGFALSLSKEGCLVRATYYIGAVKTDGTTKTQRLFNNQRKLLFRLKQHGYTYSLGYLLRTDGVFHEKGIDVKIAVDILEAAYENLADQIVLVSSDTDLLPAVRKAKDIGKTVKYVGFSHQRSLAMISECSSSVLLTKEQLRPYFKACPQE